MVAYGKADVENASNAGAVENLLVLDNMVRKEEIENIMNLVENTGGKVMVVSSEHEGGKQLGALGGIAGLLRYSVR
jgi:protein pelota